MSSFGNWLGESNGDTMVAECFSLANSKEQARSAVVTYCMLFDVEVDTADWDRLIVWLYKNYNSFSKLDTLSKFDEYMAELLV